MENIRCICLLLRICYGLYIGSLNSSQLYRQLALMSWLTVVWNLSCGESTSISLMMKTYHVVCRCPMSPPSHILFVVFSLMMKTYHVAYKCSMSAVWWEPGKWLGYWTNSPDSSFHWLLPYLTASTGLCTWSINMIDACQHIYCNQRVSCDLKV